MGAAPTRLWEAIVRKTGSRLGERVRLSAAVLKWRRPEIYRGSPAQWEPGGIPVLPILGIGCTALACFAIGLDFAFRKQLAVGNLGSRGSTRGPAGSV